MATMEGAESDGDEKRKRQNLFGHRKTGLHKKMQGKSE